MLSSFETIPVCVGYRLRDGSVTADFPPHQSDFHHASRRLRGAARLGHRHLRRHRLRRPARRRPRLRALGGGAARAAGDDGRRRAAPRPDPRPPDERRRRVNRPGASAPAAASTRWPPRWPARPRSTELHAAPGNPGIAALAACHPVHVLDIDGIAALARGRSTPTWSSSAPRRRSWPGVADAVRAQPASPCSGPAPPRPRAGGIEGVREGASCRRPACRPRACFNAATMTEARAALAALDGPVRGEGRRPRRRQGRASSATTRDEAEARCGRDAGRRLARRRRPHARDRGAPDRPRGVAARALRRRDRRAARRRRRTSSASATATRAEHRRHGRVLARARRRRGQRRRDLRRRPRAGAARARPAAASTSAAASTPA